MDLVMTQYIEISFLGISLLAIMLFFMIGFHPASETDDNSFFVKLLITNIIVLVCDISIYFLRFHNSKSLVILNYIVCSIYFIMHSYFGYNWFRYCLKNLYPASQPSKFTQSVFWIPHIINTVIVSLSPWTQWIYSLTAENRYVRGNFLWITIALSYLYWIASAVLVLRETINPRRIRETTVYGTLLFFPIPTLVGNIVQIAFYGITIIWICSALSLLVLFINIQNYHISHDLLTGLFNRRQTNQQILREINRLPNANDLLFALMVDIDKFKLINDKYGHLIGDQAIITVSDILKKAFGKKILSADSAAMNF